MGGTGSEAAVELSVAGTQTGSIYSSVLSAPVNGIKASTVAVTMKNVYAGGTTSYSGSALSLTTCASADASTGTAGLRSMAYSTANFTNVTSGSEDLQIVTGGSPSPVDTGTDTTGDSAPLNFTTDIAGTTRTGTWDIGAFAAAGSVAIRRRSVIIQ